MNAQTKRKKCRIDGRLCDAQGDINDERELQKVPYLMLGHKNTAVTRLPKGG
jgi:hypothetical protein